MESPFEEVWLESPDGQYLCALINGDRGWLMYLREEGDSGFSSRNPGYDGPPEAQIEYRLSNGQLDLYPASWALPIAEIRRAIAYFEQEHQRPPFIVWHEDGGEFGRRSKAGSGVVQVVCLGRAKGVRNLFRPEKVPDTFCPPRPCLDEVPRMDSRAAVSAERRAWEEEFGKEKGTFIIFARK